MASRVSMERQKLSVNSAVKSTLGSCRSLAEKALSPFKMEFPPEKSFELYLIRGLNTIKIKGKDHTVVVFPPEFMFVLDVGFKSLVGISVYWQSPQFGYGDPTFPDFSKADLRSILSRTERHLIYPIIAGEIIIGIRDNTPKDRIVDALTNAQLQNVEIFDNFVTAKCCPFHERAICAKLEADLPFVKYAEPSSVVRLIDIGPGWSAQRLS
jgi:hypothetical protein